MKKLRQNDGFSTVYLVLIMSSLIFLIIIAYEAAAGNAASAAAENICLTAGRSVLSEYQPQLYSRYGIFALKARDDDLSEIASYYIGRSCGGRGVVAVSLTDCEVNTERYPGLSAAALSEQINRLGMLCAAKAVLDETDLAALFGSLADSEQVNSEKASQSLRELNSLKDYTDAEPAYEDPETGELVEEKPESPEAAETRRQARRLLQDYKKAIDPDRAGEAPDGGKVLDRAAAGSLPTADLGIGKTASVLLSGGALEIGGRSVLTGEYILTVCSDALGPNPEGALSYESEYILYGSGSDRENAAAARRAVFGIRFAANLAEIFADPEKMSELSSLAASAFSFIPLPAAVFMLASIDAGICAGEELSEIMDGGTVPLIKTVPSFGSYRDYLRILLLALDNDIKTARLMDIMQLEVQRISGRGFCFRDYAYGFELHAEFDKPVRFSKFLDIGDRRHGEIDQIHTYR